MTIPQRRVEPCFELALPLRVQVLRSGRVAADRAGDATDLPRDPERRELLSVRRLVAGLPKRPSQLELVHEADGSRKAVRGRRLREVVELAGVGVEAALVGPDAGGEKEALVGRQELLLCEESQVLDERARLADCDVCTRIDVLLTGRQVSARDARDVESAASVLQTDRRRGGKRVAGRRVRVHRARVHVQVQVVAVGQQRCAGLPVVGLKLQLRGEEQRVLLRKEVSASRGDEPQIVRWGLNRVPLQRARPDEPPHVLVVRHERGRLHGVARDERVAGKCIARLLSQVHEAWRGRQHDVEARARVVVVRQPTLRQGARVAGVETGMDAGAEPLVEVETQGLALETSVIDDAAIVLGGRRGEVLGVLSPAGQADRRLVGQRLAARQLILERECLPRGVPRSPEIGVGRIVPEVLRGAWSERAYGGDRIRENPRAHFVRDFERPQFLRDGELWAAALPPLRLDHDDAVRRLLSVDSARRRPA